MHRADGIISLKVSPRRSMEPHLVAGEAGLVVAGELTSQATQQATGDRSSRELTRNLAVAINCVYNMLGAEGITEEGRLPKEPELFLSSFLFFPLPENKRSPPTHES